VVDESPSTGMIDKPAEIKAVAIPIESHNWAEIISKLNLTGFARTAIENAEFVAKDGREVTLRVATGHQSLFTPTTSARIEAALSEYYNSSIKILLNNEKTIHSSPAQQKMRSNNEKQQATEAALQNDPMFQQLQKEFSAEVVKNSIVPLKDSL
jgi:DNA polymerase III subunit gamma/tau